MQQPRTSAAFSSRSNASEKRGHTILPNSMAAYSSSASNSTGPGGGGGTAAANKQASDLCEQTNVVATLASHTSTATPIASLVLPPPGKSHLMNASPSVSSSPSSSSAAKRFLIQRVRSQSRSDAQSVPDKSLFSRFFPKKSKKTSGSLLATSAAKSIDLDISHPRAHLMHQSSLSSNDPRLPVDEFDEDDEFDERIISTGSLSDHHRLKEDGIHATRSSTTSRPGSRTNSGSEKPSASHRNPSNLLGSDSAYYVSMSSAPKGISISYHKCLNRGNDNLRKQAVLGRFQQQSKEAEGANPLMVCSTGCTATLKLSSLYRNDHLFFSFLSFGVLHSCVHCLV